MYHRIVLLILALAFLSSGITSAEQGPSEAVKSSFVGIPVPFIENKGHIHGDVAYYAKTFGGTVFVTRDGSIVYGLPEGNKETKDHTKNGLLNKEEGQKAPTLQRAVAVKETLVNGKVKAVKGESVPKAKVSYFKGNDPSKWQSGIQTYELVSLGEVYKGIHVKLKAYGKNVEKLFYVKPGANPEDIKIKLEGLNAIQVNEKGELELSTDLGPVTFTKPVAYQEIEGRRVDVDVSYKVIETKGNTKSALYAFNLGNYDKTKELVIDPLLASTFIKGSFEDIAYSIALDTSGNVYVAGSTSSSDFPTTQGAYDITKPAGADTDVFVCKLNSGLTELLASTFIGGLSWDRAYSIALDSSGNVYVTGYTESTDYPATAGAYSKSNNGFEDIIISKLTGDLSQLLASTYIGGSMGERGYSIALDNAGNVYVTGYTNSGNYPVTDRAYDSQFRGGHDVIVSKLSGDLSQLLASTFVGGGFGDFGYSIALDAAGNVYVTGGTASGDYPVTQGAYDTRYNGAISDVFVSKLSGDLSELLASTFMGGDHDDYGYSMIVDSLGNVYIAGSTNSPNFPTTEEAYDKICGTDGRCNNLKADAFVLKLNGSLTQLLASTFIGGSEWDSAYSIALDSSGNLYVTGGTNSSDFPTTVGAFDVDFNGAGTAGGPNEVFVTKLSGSLNTMLASTFIGGNHDECGRAISLDGAGNVYVSGWTASPNFPTT